MSGSLRWLNWAAELQSLAQAGLEYSRDPYDLERFERRSSIPARPSLKMTGFCSCVRMTGSGRCLGDGRT